MSDGHLKLVLDQVDKMKTEVMVVMGRVGRDGGVNADIGMEREEEKGARVMYGMDWAGPSRRRRIWEFTK